MTTNSSSVPQAREALNKFKYEVASEIGVPLKQGYNGDLTSAQAGYVGGYMVKNICPIRTISHPRQRRVFNGKKLQINYLCSIIS
ncbi:MAG: alpha/beta-type small acid-soluble spore protein [Clostridiales bacterium]|jgi:hypothetical protein|nr:alpha/beta-type small acid-soluble spore protein [Clostridiales bacterium]